MKSGIIYRPFLVLFSIMLLGMIGCGSDEENLFPGESVSWQFQVDMESTTNDTVWFELNSNGGASFTNFDITFGEMNQPPQPLNPKADSKLEFSISEGGIYQVVFHYKDDSLSTYPKGESLRPYVKLVRNTADLNGNIKDEEGVKWDNETSILEDDLDILLKAPPTPKWQIWGGISTLIILILVLVFLILKRDNMPLGKKTFKAGMLTFPNGDAKVSNVRLEKLYSYGLNDAFGDLLGIELQPVDKKQKDKTARFARLKCNSVSLKVKIKHGGTEEVVGAYYDLLHQDEVKITNENNMEFLFRYSNVKNKRL